MKVIKEVLYNFGRYAVFMLRVFAKPEKASPYYLQILRELRKMGVNSIGIVVIISLFIGAVITLQTSYNLNNALIPRYVIGLGTRDSMLLEFSSTMIALILAGKVGSNIASELGTMRISEQIDALEIMGINSAGYLVLPKLIAALIFFPLLTIMSMIMGIIGGWLVSITTDLITPATYIMGLRTYFVPYFIVYSLVKMLVFAFIISTVSSYWGFYVKGGAVGVGRASTKAVVYSSVLILLFNLIITQLMLT